ncbi:Acg family FMN-binding oxidoreductase [Segniliparus rugosus]|uniref:NAD(P)H nitroreductase n=1 Tax=Segniliparus rugosus (strain ATCC BAA-974 / DSM 45345 / CCUG 50838 / CIP 108380 / JCM 13579 / CDC 945) TaxID=679197 RepID=E5XQD1_SEGRC|nr:hypothetical protein [Segniliparus rugosus]EFV13452.1 hypothetical protein HMPREF9336_01703 [Segniliparus rugosus ATCC BAA-974]
MSRTFPDDRTVAAVISLADRAPSLHNSQPWLWRVGRESVHLYADPARQLREADPDGRELLISCGAALHHARLAFAALGWRAETRRLPNPAEPAHLAAIELHRHDPSATEVMLCAAISARNSDRRRLSPRSVPGHVVEAMERAAAAEGALLAAADSIARRTLSTAAVEAAGHHSASLEYRREIERWTGKHLSSDGVLAVSTPPVASGPNDMPDRRFTAPGLWQSAAADHCSDDEIRGSGDVILTLSTALDDRAAQLRAGEATSAALLAAAQRGLSTCLLTEALEIPATRSRIRREVTGQRYPQAIIRVGWPPEDGSALASAPRRAAHEVLAPLSTAQRYETRP